MPNPPLERLRHFGHWAGLRATLPFSLLKGQCGTKGFGILMYHRVCPPVAGVAPPTWNVAPDRLHQQLSYLLRRGFEPWRLTDLVKAASTGQPIPRRAFAVTFDDGYRCVATQALPILEALNVPATIFLATSLVGQPGPMPQDDWDGAGNKNVPPEYYEALTIDECKNIAQSSSIDLGSHSHSHQDFRGRIGDFIDDIEASAKFFSSHWELKDIPFAFPYGCSLRGFCDHEMRDAVRNAGFACALTADVKIVEPTDNPFAWGRITAKQQDSGKMLAAKLDNWYGAIKKIGLRYFTNVGFTNVGLTNVGVR